MGAAEAAREAPGGAVGALCARGGALAFACLPTRLPPGGGAGGAPLGGAPPLPRVFFCAPSGAGGGAGPPRELGWPAPLSRPGAGGVALALGGTRLCAASRLGVACWGFGPGAPEEGVTVAEGGGFSGVVAVSPDGMVFAGAGLEGGNVTAVALRPTGAGGGAEGSSGCRALGESGRLSLEARAVVALSFGTHDADLLVAACGDRTVRVWNLAGASGEALCFHSLSPARSAARGGGHRGVAGQVGGRGEKGEEGRGGRRGGGGGGSWTSDGSRRHEMCCG